MNNQRPNPLQAVFDAIKRVDPTKPTVKIIPRKGVERNGQSQEIIVKGSSHVERRD
jgi:hypothetical protein